MAELPPIFNMGFDYPGFEIKVELVVFNKYLKNLETGIEAVCNSYIQSEIKCHTREEYNEYQHIYLIAEDEIPRIIRLPLVISIYSIYENSITQLLAYAQMKENKQEALKNVKGKTLSSKFNNYMKNILNYDFQINEKLMKTISELSKIRNCIAHANGNLIALDINKANELKTLEKSEPGIIIMSDKIDVSYQFLESTMNEVESGVRSLMDYMEYRYGAK